jgi:hypothetical protein
MARSSEALSQQHSAASFGRLHVIDLFEFETLEPSSGGGERAPAARGA